MWPLVVLSGIQGIFFGSSDAGNSVSFLRLHGSKANPWLQAMHFTYAIGTTVCSGISLCCFDFGCKLYLLDRLVLSLKELCSD